MHAAGDVAGDVGALVLGLAALLAHGAAALLRRAWAAPYIGHLLRLGAAVAVWGLAVAASRATGHIVIHVLTGA